MRNKRKREHEDKKRGKRAESQRLRKLILEEVERLNPWKDKPLTEILNKLGPRLE